MPRHRQRLTGLKVSKVKKPGLYADGGGLYLQVTASHSEGSKEVSKSWLFRYAKNGKEHRMGLGSVSTFSLAEARERATEARKVLASGKDPIQTRDAEHAAIAVEQAKMKTFEEYAKDYIAAHEKGWKRVKQSKQWTSTLSTYAYPVIGDLPVAAIDTPLVLKVIKPLWSAKTETADRIRGRIESILDAAKVDKLRDGENPARWKGHLEHSLPSRQKVAPTVNHAAMPGADVSTFLEDMRTRENGSISSKALEFCILVAGRTDEVLGARWEEFNFADKIWTVPATRMKAGKEHRIPLSPAALNIVEGLRGVDPVWIFAENGDRIGKLRMARILERMNLKGSVTVHGFRSTFKDWASDNTSFPSEMAEIALAHKVGTKVEQAYRRSDMMERRRKMMTAWAQFITTPATTANVIPMKKAQ
jgi:integrase